jgi:hypothetical protein
MSPGCSYREGARFMAIMWEQKLHPWNLPTVLAGRKRTVEAEVGAEVGLVQNQLVI